ncbi:MAG: transcriptional repressor [Paludibacter sp.]|nr:transcriptional repressor [Paludibacter sp.]
MNAKIIETLEKNAVKPTPVRMLVLEQMIVQQRSLSLSDLENLLYPADRITIYRTLQTFVKNGIAHIIEHQHTGSVYALCPEGCTHGTHIDDHPHFFCEKCGKIICTNDFSYKLFQHNAASKYEVHKTEMTISGLCPECKKQTLQ